MQNGAKNINIRKTVNFWRMSFREGSSGKEMWPTCRDKGIAALGYWNRQGKLIVEDCSQIDRAEFEAAWRKQDPRNTSGRASLRAVAYEFEPGDIIFVKQGKDIVGCGTVLSRYKFNRKIIGNGKWPHYVEVQWNEKFTPCSKLLGSEPRTVLRLEGDRLKDLLLALQPKDNKRILPVYIQAEERLKQQDRRSDQDLESIRDEERHYPEGPKGRHYTNYYERNSGLRKATLRYHGIQCQVCGFDFEETYGDRGKDFVEVHHLRPVSHVRNKIYPKPKTDMAAVCANCHRMIHRRKNNILTLKKLKMMIDSTQKRRIKFPNSRGTI